MILSPIENSIYSSYNQSFDSYTLSAHISDDVACHACIYCPSIANLINSIACIASKERLRLYRRARSFNLQRDHSTTWIWKEACYSTATPSDYPH